MFDSKVKILGLFFLLAGCSDDSNIKKTKDNTSANNQQVSTTTYRKPSQNPNENLLYRVNSQLIVSAKGNEFSPYYNESSTLINFLGQIPVDFQPHKNNKIAINSYKNANSINNMLEFILLLDNQPITSPYKQDFYQYKKNKVFVRVTNISNIIPNEHNSDNLGTPKQMFDLRLKQFSVQKSAIFPQDNMNCFDTEHYKFCIGENNIYKTQVFLTISKSLLDKELLEIDAFNNSQKYGGMRIEWRYSAESIRDWKKIDNKIWDLLDKLNIADTGHNKKNETP